jgi:hypothetical protein
MSRLRKFKNTFKLHAVSDVNRLWAMNLKELKSEINWADALLFVFSVGAES